MQNKHLSLDHGWDLEDYEIMNLCEEDGLEAWHQRQAEYEREQEAFFAMARSRFQFALESGAIKKRLSKQQVQMVKMVLYEKKSVQEIADELKVLRQTVDKQLLRAVIKLRKFFK